VSRHPLRLGVLGVTTCLAVLLMTGAASALSTGNGGWQWQNPLPQGRDLPGAYFIDAAHGWLISGGEIFHTSDGGVTLTMQARHNVTFRDITFVDARFGWAVGNPANLTTANGIVYRTTNGGRTWTRVRVSLRGGISGVSFANRKVGWAVCGRDVLHTIDGGLHWAIRDLHGNGSFKDVQALTTRRAWACGNNNVLTSTVDGGATWKRVGTGTHQHLIAIHFVDPDNGWIVGVKTVLHTADGGAHWASEATTGQTIGALSFADSQNGWATSPTGAVYHTTDAGAHWLQQTTAPAAPWSWVLALTQTDAIIGGAGGRLARTSDGGASWQSSTRVAADYSGDLNAVQFLDAATGWTVGSAGEILKTTTGGAAWMAQTSNTTEDLNGFDFIDTNDGWAVGDQGAIVHTADGGATWTPQSSGVTDDLAAVSFFDAQHGWAVGGQQVPGSEWSTGVILATVDGGQHWVKQTTPVVGARWHDVVFADALHGWAVGEVAGDSAGNVTVIITTVDGGATWTKQLLHVPATVNGNSSDAELRAIACIDATHLVAVGFDDGSTELLRTSNGGKTWTSVAFVQPSSWSGFLRLVLTDVVFTDATHGWAVGEGTVIRTTDGGVTWSTLASGPENATALSFVSRTQGWAVGRSADILTTITGGLAP
jgi:photosystem II stability/assembly factor-like uncharacterized protein